MREIARKDKVWSVGSEKVCDARKRDARDIHAFSCLVLSRALRIFYIDWVEGIFHYRPSIQQAIRFILLQFCPSVLLVAFEYLFSLLFSVLINPMPFQSVISSRYPVTDLVFAELALYCFSRPCNSQLLTFPRRSRYWKPLMLNLTWFLYRRHLMTESSHSEEGKSILSILNRPVKWRYVVLIVLSMFSCFELSNS